MSRCLSTARPVAWLHRAVPSAVLDKGSRFHIQFLTNCNTTKGSHSCQDKQLGPSLFLFSTHCHYELRPQVESLDKVGPFGIAQNRLREAILSSRLIKNPFRPSPCPFLTRKAVELVSGGHPQTSSKEALPLWTPLLNTLPGVRLLRALPLAVTMKRPENGATASLFDRPQGSNHNTDKGAPQGGVLVRCHLPTATVSVRHFYC